MKIKRHKYCELCIMAQCYKGLFRNYNAEEGKCESCDDEDTVYEVIFEEDLK